MANYPTYMQCKVRGSMYLIGSYNFFVLIWLFLHVNQLDMNAIHYNYTQDKTRAILGLKYLTTPSGEPKYWVYMLAVYRKGFFPYISCLSLRGLHKELTTDFMS